MNHKVHNQIVNFIWNIADDVLRDVYTRGKYRDIILPFTVLRRLDALLVPTKESVLETDRFLIDNKIDNKSGLTDFSDYRFYNTSPFTFADSSLSDAKYPYKALLSEPDKINSNLEIYLDGFSPNVQEIINKFKLRNQLETMRDAGITFALIEKFASKDINLTPNETVNARGETLPPLTNLGMGYVFEELIRRFNEENNEEAGEHFTPRDIIKLMTHILFLPLKEQLTEGGTYLIYDPACGSGGMLTEAENFAREITESKSNFFLYGQEVNPEIYALCKSDMLIKGKDPENIVYGSTLSTDGFPDRQFDFMLSNPPYGKSWKIDYDAIIGDGKQINDHRFRVGVPRSSDGQLLFLTNMAAKMKHGSDSKLGSHIASVHNGSVLFTGDAGSGESEIRKRIIENDWLDCIIGLPPNMFYNTGISTYIFILNNRKPEHRRGKIQLIDASEMYVKMRKSLGNKSHELTTEQINQITQIYIDFKEGECSKIFDNSDFGYSKITVERPLRLSAKFTPEAIEALRFNDTIRTEMEWIYHRFGDEVYKDLTPHKENIESYLAKNQIKITSQNKKKLLNIKIWQAQKKNFEVGQNLLKFFGDKEYKDFNKFKEDVDDALSNIKLSASEKKAILNAVSWKDENAEKVIKRKVKLKKGVPPQGNQFPISNPQDSQCVMFPDNSAQFVVEYEPDAELRDTENVPLKEDVQEYFAREVLPHVPDAWIDSNKTVTGYEISFTKYFYQYQLLRSLDEIKADILAIEQETEGLLHEIIDE